MRSQTAGALASILRRERLADMLAILPRQVRRRALESARVAAPVTVNTLGIHMSADDHAGQDAQAALRLISSSSGVSCRFFFKVSTLKKIRRLPPMARRSAGVYTA